MCVAVPLCESRSVEGFDLPSVPVGRLAFLSPLFLRTSWLFSRREEGEEGGLLFQSNSHSNGINSHTNWL